MSGARNSNPDNWTREDLDRRIDQRTDEPDGQPAGDVIPRWKADDLLLRLAHMNERGDLSVGEYEEASLFLLREPCILPPHVMERLRQWAKLRHWSDLAAAVADISPATGG